MVNLKISWISWFQKDFLVSSVLSKKRISNMIPKVDLFSFGFSEEFEDTNMTFWNKLTFKRMRFNEIKILKSSSAVGNSTQAPWLALKCIVETCRIDFILKPFLPSFFSKKAALQLLCKYSKVDTGKSRFKKP